MREVTFKNRYFSAAHKREVCIEEIIAENGCVSKTTKRSLYFVQDIRTMGSEEEFNTWLKENEGKTATDRNFHIMKIQSNMSNTSTVLCKAKGSFYIVVGRDVYNIVYLHCLRMEIKGPKTEKVC